MRWLRRDALPGEVREHLTLQRGERILASAAGPAGWVVVTTHAVWLPIRAQIERVGWEHVDSAAWNQDEGVLTVVQAAPLGGRARQWFVRVDDARDLLLVVKERVRATVVVSRRLLLDGDQGVTIVGRRPPGHDDVSWTVSVDVGVDPTDPAVRAEIDRALLVARGDVGG